MYDIPHKEVTFHPNSFGDPDGRLFRWNGQLYRGIGSEQAKFFANRSSFLVLQQLMQRGLLIESEVVPYLLDGYAAVVRHKTIPFAAYTHEWCAAMLKDAGLTILDLAIELAQHGMILKDAHPWNVLFDSYKPVFVDLTSIVPIPGDVRWSFYKEFCQYTLYPLILMADGHERIARWLLWEYTGVQEADVRTLARTRRRLASAPSLAQQCLKMLGSLFSILQSSLHSME